jgi:acetyl-CoA acyltransferase
MSMALFTGGLRTAFGRAFKGAFAEVRPDDLLVALLKEQSVRQPALWEHGPQDLIIGCAYPESEQGYNIGRMAALGAGLGVPGMTVNRLCASSLEAAAIGAARIRAGWGETYLVGGIESMSRVKRRGENFSESDGIKNTWPEAYVTMGETAENLSRKYPAFTRTRQEDFAEQSHRLAHEAHEAGFYKDQVFEFKTSRDEFIRYPVDRAKMASLEPCFDKAGVVTAATSSALTDGATSGWVISESCARNRGVPDGLEILDCTWGHVAPELMGIGPVVAVRELLQRNSLGVDAIAAWELNEAFSIQSLVCIEELGLPPEQVNPCGGALALGHPLGASGLRLLITLQGRMKASGEEGALGVATLCVGGGQGMALLVRYRRFA